MSTLFKHKHNKIDQKFVYLVYGYNRRILKDIPDEVSNVCLLFYFEYDAWDKQWIHQDIKLIDATTIEKTKRSSRNAFLTKEFESGQHEWTFKVIRIDKKQDVSEECNRITIGIFDINACKILPLKSHFMDEQGQTESNTVTINFMNKNDGHELEAGDIIKMFVDFDKLQLKWTVNGIDYDPNEERDYAGWEEDRVNLSMPRTIAQSKYRAGVNLFVEGDSIQLL